jgi:hypothetical protein
MKEQILYFISRDNNKPFITKILDYEIKGSEGVIKFIGNFYSSENKKMLMESCYRIRKEEQYIDYDKKVYLISINNIENKSEYTYNFTNENGEPINKQKENSEIIMHFTILLQYDDYDSNILNELYKE